MKKMAFSVAVLTTAFLGGAPTASAGGIDYLTNQSADYIRTLGRNAATDAADIVSFNPAGTAFLPNDGLYFNLSAQTILKSFEITYKEEVFGADDPTPILPSLFVLYKWNSLAAFGSFTVPAGGGNLTYEKGVPFLIPLGLQVTGGGMPTDGEFSGSSMYLAGTLGVAYEFFDMVSISAAARLISAKKTFTGQAQYTSALAKLDATKTALGVSGIFGLHLRPIKQLDIGFRYEVKTALEFETESTTENLKTDPGKALESFANGARERRDLPAVLGVGLAYHIIEPLTVNANLTWYFNKAADGADDVPGNTGYVKSYDDDYDDGMELAFSVEYQFTDELLASVGYDRALQGGGAATYSDFEYALDSHAVGGGIRYTFIERLNLTVAFSTVFYEEAKNESVHPLISIVDTRGEPYEETFDKAAYVFALGLQYRL